jgi:2-polyprenyl-6-methoxyphenol hydroxylase-like FAD-dependent oxidoreductase
LLNKNIVDIEHQSHGVIVRCDGNSSFRGDILAGADGVRSRTREELWKLAKPIQPELVRHDENGKFVLGFLHSVPLRGQSVFSNLD